MPDFVGSHCIRLQFGFVGGLLARFQLTSRHVSLIVRLCRAPTIYLTIAQDD